MPKKAQKHAAKPLVLLILDGFGLSRNKDGNAPMRAKMPAFKRLLRKYPHTTLRADSESVGLPHGEVGNSEAGHQTIGAGRQILADKVIIDRAIKDKSFFSNPALLQAIDHAKKNNSTLHLMGLLTNSQSAHASLAHVFALIKLCRSHKVQNIAIHLFTDGRDTHPFHALKLLNELESKLPKNFQIATISGRFYAMDRNRNWKRTKMVYDCLVHGKCCFAKSAALAIEQAYENGLSDEFIEPTAILNDHKPNRIKANDAVIFWNLRSDRARQLAKPFIASHFSDKNTSGFARGPKLKNLRFITLTEFGKQLDHAIAAFPHHEITDTLVEALRSRKQIYIAESEKYAHVTYFFNGGFDNPRFGEDRIRIPSARVKTFDQAPQMRAHEIAKKVASSVKKGYDFICANLANPDMVAHTGDFNATKKACEAVDRAIDTVYKATSKSGGTVIITADHGNAEEVRKKNGHTDTHHNANPVPFILCGAEFVGKHLKKGSLSDIAPTILNLLHEPIPKKMTGKNLLKN